MTNRAILWLLVGGGVFGLFLLTVAALVLTLAGGAGSAFGIGERIHIVNVEGALLDSRGLLEELKRFEATDSVPAILLNIDSPGGDVATSQEVYRELLRLREESGKTVVAYMSSTGASGAYYIACAADLIVSSPGSIVGSIGVIGEWLEYPDLLEWAMIRDVVFKSGEFKDTGNPMREMTPAETAYFQALIDDIYLQFVEAVAEGRGLEVEEVSGFADGRVFTGRQALDLGMVDEIGNLQDAINRAAELAEIQGVPGLIEARPADVSVLDLLTGSVADIAPAIARLADSRPRFQYLWK